MQAIDFMGVEQHFLRLVDGMPGPQKRQYLACKHTRVETAYRKRSFIVYEMSHGTPDEIDRLVIQDFHADHEKGMSTMIESEECGGTMLLDYTPRQVFHHNVFMWIPLHAKVRWGATDMDIVHGSLGFPLCVRTQSRLGLREEGVTYCETGVSYGKEFNGSHVD